MPVFRPRDPLGTGKSASERHKTTAANPCKYEHQRRQDPERKKYHRNYQRERRAVPIAAGLCTRCSNTSIPGETYCETCRYIHRNKRAEYERNRNR